MLNQKLKLAVSVEAAPLIVNLLNELRNEVKIKSRIGIMFFLLGGCSKLVEHTHVRFLGLFLFKMSKVLDQL